MEIRNIAIIAHVDHGKTTLTDAIMRQTGMFEDNMSMDINALEQERGITIYAKNTATFYKGTKINIVDTPEGPMPQTRFVLKKSLELGFRPIVVINKIDKPAADPERTEEQVLELFLELGASDQQTDFTVVYAVGKDGVAMRTLDGEHRDISPLLDIILEQVPCAENNRDIPLRAQPFNLGYDNFLGRLAVARIYEGVLHAGDTVQILTPNGNAREGNINKLFMFRGVAREEVREADAGDIVMIAGLADVFIGETICIDKNQKPLPAIEIDEPTITLNFLVNNSPFAGREGKFLTSRQIRERLMRELEVNVGLKVDFSEPDRFKIFGRGELHVAILLENMRREGYEIQVSQPRVIIKEIDGQKKEPYEEVTIDVPSEFQGAVIEKLGKRRAILKDVRSQWHG